MANAIITAEVKNIKPNPKNPRLVRDEKFKKLKQSIQDFPDMLNKRPLVCYTNEDGTFTVLGGNQRLKAAKELKLKELPIALADNWTEAQRDEFLIKDNVQAGVWDIDMLFGGWTAATLVSWGIDEPEGELQEKQEFSESMSKYNDENCLYPIVPKFDERQELFVIISENEIDANWLREKLGMQKMKSYKTNAIAKSNVIHINDLKDVL